MHLLDEGQGRPLVFLHGWSCPGVFFRHQLGALRGRARCLVPDLPGHGRKGGNVPLTIEAAADAVHGALEARGLRNAILCGWSMGALVAYSLVERHGVERVSKVVVLDMTPKVLNTQDWQNGTLNGLNDPLNQVFLEAIVADWPKLPALIARRLFAYDLPVDPGLFAFARDEIAKADPGLLRPMWASLTAQDFRPLLQSFPVPLHLVAGLRSQLYGAGVAKWHTDHVPDLTLHLFEQSGHAPHLEETARFNELMLTLL